MLNVNSNDILCIGVGEKEKYLNGETYSHAFLILYKEFDNGDVEILQQLHYDQNVDEDNIADPFVLSGLKSPANFHDVSISPLKSGNALEMLPVWNHMLSYALEIKHVNESGFCAYTFTSDFRHSEHAYNCRSYAIVTLQNAGIHPCEEDFIGIAGTAAIHEEFDLPDFEGDFSKASTNGYLGLDNLKYRNRELLEGLAGEFLKPHSGHFCRIPCPAHI